MDHDEYKEIINGKNTFKVIATQLKKGQAVLIGWTDERGSHFDFLFTYKVGGSLGQVLNNTTVGNVVLSGSYQGGIRPTDLFVSVMRVGAFGFEVTKEDTHWGYYDEKLTGGFGEVTGKAVADLINGIKKELVK